MRRSATLGAWTVLVACSAPAPPERDDTALSASTKSADESLIVEPSDKGSALIAAVSAAQVSAHVTMYILADAAVLNALVARHQAGVDVKVVLNDAVNRMTADPTAADDEDDPSALEDVVASGGSTTSPNQKAYDALTAAGVPVVWAPHRFLYTHEKTIVIDGTSAWIMTMNAAASSMKKNREYLVVDTKPADVAEAEQQFAADFADTTFTPTGDLVVAPVNAHAKVAALVEGATSSLAFEAEEFSDRKLTSAVCAAAGRGVKVQGVISNRAPSKSETRAVQAMKACGADLVTLAKPYVHAKAMVADGARMYVGSANFSQNSLDRNRELGVITSASQLVDTVAKTIAGDFAAGTPM